MKWRPVLIILTVVLAGLTTAVAVASLTTSQSTTGSINATSESVDLYLCETPQTTGPECGDDDSGADETIFEGLENLRPASVTSQRLRLKNVGTSDLTIVSAGLLVTEVADPGIPCDPGVLYPLEPPPLTTAVVPGVTILTDNLGDDVSGMPNTQSFARTSNSGFAYNLKIGAGSYEDVLLSFALSGQGSQDCDGNEWNVSWTFTAG